MLGNRQLLSIFFIVVVLLGMGFTLGYILGRNSAPAATTADSTAAGKKADGNAQALEPTPAPKPEAAPFGAKPREEIVESPRKAAPVETVAQADAGKPFKFGPPPAGSVFIQVAAVSKTDAELEATTLGKQGFPAWVAPNEKNAELFSVLVGPYEDKADLAKAKADLEQLGFKKAFRKEIK